MLAQLPGRIRNDVIQSHGKVAVIAMPSNMILFFLAIIR